MKMSEFKSDQSQGQNAGFIIPRVTALPLQYMGFPGGASGKEPACHAGDIREVWSLSQEDPREKEMATHSRILAQRIPWTEEPGTGYSPQGCKELDMTEAI